MANKISQNNTTNCAVQRQSIKNNWKELDKEIDGFDEEFLCFTKRKTFALCTVEQLSEAYTRLGFYDFTVVSLHFQSLMSALLWKSSKSDLHDGIEMN